MLRHWRKITVTNREQNRLEVYCMDETTVLGEALQETAVAARTLRGPRPPGGSEGEDRRIPCFQAQAPQTGQDLRSST